MIKGAPVTPEASTISGASATTEVQNNSAEVQNNSASASDPVDAEAPAKILIPLEHCKSESPNLVYDRDRSLTFILNARLKPLAKKPPKGPMTLAKMDMKMAWMKNG